MNEARKLTPEEQEIYKHVSLKLVNAIEECWMEGQLGYKLHAAQKIIYDTLRAVSPDIRESVALCARRFGKSYLGVLMAIEDCLRNPGVYVRIIGPEISQTINIVEPLLTKIISDAPSGLIQRKAAEHRWRVGQSFLVVGGFDNKNIQKHLGQESYSIYIEETGVSNADDYTYAQREVLSPHLLHSRGKRVHLTTPPVEPTHPFVIDVIPKAKLNGVYFEYTIYDNPLLDETQIKEAIEESGGLDTDAFKRNYLCHIIRDAHRTVFPEFNRAAHVKRFELSKPNYFITSIDFGGKRDKTVALLCYYDWHTGRDIVLDERMFEVNTDTKTIIDSVLKMEAEHEVDYDFHSRYADSPGQLQVDCNSIYNFHFTIPCKDNVDAAINAVRFRLGDNKLVLHERCKFLSLTLDSAQYNEMRTDFMRSEALGHNDAGMALVYAVRSIDRDTNPYPGQSWNPHVSTPFRHQQDNSLQQAAQAIVPKRFGSFK